MAVVQNDLVNKKSENLAVSQQIAELQNALDDLEMENSNREILLNNAIRDRQNEDNPVYWIP